MTKKLRYNFCFTRIWAKHNTWGTSKGMEIALEKLRFLSPKLKNDCFPFVTAFNHSKNAATEDKAAFLPTDLYIVPHVNSLPPIIIKFIIKEKVSYNQSIRIN